MINIRNFDLKSYAVISLLVLWASLTFSIALTEISFVCALIFWGGWHIQLRMGAQPSLSFPHVLSGGDDSKSDAVSPRPMIDWALWTPLALFFVTVLVSFFSSEYPKESFRGIFKIAKPLLVFVMATNLFRDTKPQKRFDGIFLAIFLLVTIDCSIQYAFGKDILRGFAAEPSAAGLRLVGPFGNFAKMATYLVLVIPILAMQFLRLDHRKISFYSLALAVAGGVLLYMTRCRGAMVALALSTFFLFIYKRWFKALGVALLLCLALLAVTPKNMIVHDDITYKEQSLRERYQLWRRALFVIEAKPWLGTGINTYNAAHAKYDKAKHWRVRGYYAHNGYLQLAAEIGLPGIFCFLWFLLMYFRRAFRSVRQVRGTPEEFIQLGLVTSLLAFLIYATADNNLQSPPSLMMFWYLAGVLKARQNLDPINTRCSVSNTGCCNGDRAL